MKLQNSFRDYSAESALFVRRALVAFLGILLLTGVLIANLYNLQIAALFTIATAPRSPLTAPFIR